jgi:hypothetical protein
VLRAQEEAQKEGPVYPTDGSEYPSEYHVVTGAWPADLIVLGRRHAAIVLAGKFVGTGDIIPSCRRTRPEVTWDELDSATPHSSY